jgi:hypothetical protein
MIRSSRAVLVFALAGCATDPTPQSNAEPAPRVDARSAAPAVMTPGLRAAFVRARQEAAGAEYAFVREAAGRYAARSAPHGLVAALSLDGVRITPDGGARGADPSWSLGLRLTAVRRGDRIRELEPARGSLAAEKNRARFEHQGGISEWYIAGPLGIEQGFELAHRPLEGAEELVLAVAVQGELVPELRPSAPGRAGAGASHVGLRTPRGEAVLRYSDLFAHDADGVALRTEMRVASGAIELVIDDRGARYPVSVDPLVSQEDRKLVASDQADGDRFGVSVAISGDLAIVGAHLEDGAGAGDARRGAAYVYERGLGGTDNWGERRKLVASDPEDNAQFGWSVAISGDVAIVGALLDDSTDRGAAYVFERNFGGADSWGERKKLGAGDASANDNFGSSVAISGNLALVGASHEQQESVPGSGGGAAYVFERNLGGADNWGQRVKLVAFDRAAGDDFGTSVAISGDLALAGAPLKSNSRGAAYVFERNLGGVDLWTQRRKLTASDAEDQDRFGHSVAISGNLALVGAYSEDGAGLDRGAAYVFERNLGGADSWSQRKKLFSSDASDQDAFGLSVAISADLAVVGAQRGGGASNGAVYFFERNFDGAPDSWIESKAGLASDPGADDGFGASIALSGTVAVVGAYLQSAGGPNRGAAYVYEYEQENGAVCELGSHCASGFCVDGVCCNVECAGGTGDCMACSAAAGAAANGTCGPTANGSGCDDGVFCNGADTCASGACTGAHTGDPCAANVGDADDDCSESCDEATDGCTAADPNNSACDDGLYCTGVDTCTGGACVPAGDPCAGTVGDGDTDCSESCNEAADDCTAYDPEGSSCDDGLYCTGVDTCASGACVSAGDPCGASIGDADADCSESCDETTHLCTANDPEGSACDDGLYCTLMETCAAGTCGGSPADPCAANLGDADTDCSESCDEASDACTATDPDSSACDDGVFCNGAEVCAAGACGGSSGDPCAASVGDADADCSESCHEGNDACEANDPGGSVCDDGLACNGGDRCIAGSCDAHALECPAAEEDAGVEPDAGPAQDAGGEAGRGTAGSRAGSGGSAGRGGSQAEEDAGEESPDGGAEAGDSEDGCGCRVVSGSQRPSLSLVLLLVCLAAVAARLRRRRNAPVTAAGNR